MSSFHFPFLSKGGESVPVHKNVRKSTRRCVVKFVKTVEIVETIETVETVETALTAHTES